MRVLTSRDGELISQFGNVNEVKTDSVFDSTCLEKMLIDNHKIAGQEANKGTVGGQLALEHIIGFCKTFEKVTKNLGVHMAFKTANL